jgi:hypothetical protein
MVTGNNSDFSGSSNWAGGGASFTLNFDSGDAGHSSTMRIESNSTAWNRVNLPFGNWAVSPTAGKSYRIKFDYKWINNTSVNAGYMYFGTTGVSDATDHTSTGTWKTSNGVYLYDGGTTYGIAFYVNGATGHADNELLIDNLTIVQVGAVAEYDGSGAGEKIWGDKSGNDLHGTVSGATLENTPYDSGTEYEEGTWTPTSNVGGSIGIATNHYSKYTKIGRIVHVQSYVVWDGNADSSLFTIGGFPFTSALLGYATGVYNHGGSVGATHIRMSSNTTYAELMDGSSDAINEDEVGATHAIFSMTYTT